MGAGWSIRGAILGRTTSATALAILIVLGGAQCLAFAIWPPSPAVDPEVLVIAGASLAVVAGLTLVVLPRLPPVFIDVWVACLTITIIAIGGYVEATPTQLVTALGLSLLAAFCGYFLPSAHVIGQILLMVGLYIAAVIQADNNVSPVVTATAVVTIVALAWLVWRVTDMLAVAAVRDPLTGVLNRRGLNESAALLHSLLLRINRRMCVVAIDLDGFKAYNDRHGHAAGDRLLTDIVASWTGSLRTTDVLARTGGDEFVLVLPDTDLSTAHSLLARLHEVSPSEWTAGIAEWIRGEDLADVLLRADQALYLAKPNGRARSDP